MRDGKAVYATVLLLLAMNISYLFVLVVRIPIAVPRLLFAIGGLMVLVGTLLLYKNKRYRLLWLAALVFHSSVGSLGYDLVFGGDTELLMWGTVALLLGVLGGGLALVREKPVV
jgi:hypothetical protein